MSVTNTPAWITVLEQKHAAATKGPYKFVPLANQTTKNVLLTSVLTTASKRAKDPEVIECEGVMKLFTPDAVFLEEAYAAEKRLLSEVRRLRAWFEYMRYQHGAKAAQSAADALKDGMEAPEWT